MRGLNFSQENLQERMKYLKTNLKFLGVWDEVDYKVRKAVKSTIQASVFADFDREIGTVKYERKKERIAYRGGVYFRNLGTQFCEIEIMVPKPIKGINVEYQAFKPYQRRNEKVDRQIILGIMLGLSGRKQEKFFKNTTGVSVSAATASNLIKKISTEIEEYQQRKIEDIYEYLYIDGIWVRVKELETKKRPLIVVLGVTKTGEKHILCFKLCKSENEQECSGLLNDLYRRGLKGKHLKLIISDAALGIRAASNYVYPYAKIQLCTVHKMRNVLYAINYKKNKKYLIKNVSKIFESKTKNEAVIRYKSVVKKWQDEEPKAINTLKKDIENYFEYYNFPLEYHKSIKSTNPLERINREIRRTTRRIGYFQNAKSAEIYTYLVLKECDLLDDKKLKSKCDMPSEINTLLNVS